jgi:hypothetical protein
VTRLDGILIMSRSISTAGAALRDKLSAALPHTSIKLYFPSEFGVDHTLHDFNTPEWDGKKKHYDLTRSAVHGTNIQVCRLFVGLFLHMGIAPWAGFHTAKNTYQAIGSLDQSISYTDISDIARVVSGLADKAMRKERVPEQLRIAGTHASFRNVAQIMSEAGAGDIELKSVDLHSFRDKALAREYEDRSALVFLRFLMGDGRIDYRKQEDGGLGNDNDVVNAGQGKFAWKTVRNLAVETGGKPHSDA